MAHLGVAAPRYFLHFAGDHLETDQKLNVHWLLADEQPAAEQRSSHD